ncbi:MAG TPA: YciI family protein [Longimicrobiales bacterium]|nr:YciI family protein [Longimicrobiales bacterium]
MAKYLLIARDGSEWETFAAQASPADMEACIGRYIAWSERLRSAGKLIASEKLKDGEGRVVRAERGETRVTDGPHVASKEVIGGFWLLSADSYDEGLELIRDHPHLEWGTLELREIEEL